PGGRSYLPPPRFFVLTINSSGPSQSVGSACPNCAVFDGLILSNGMTAAKSQFSERALQPQRQEHCDWWQGWDRENLGDSHWERHCRIPRSRPSGGRRKLQPRRESHCDGECRRCQSMGDENG